MRVLLDPPMRGAENMARDEALLAEALPTVRLYGWRPACVSLGRAQTEAEVDLDAARAWGLDVVRRATGGGAILHNEEEVTYAVVLPLDEPGLPRDIAGTFARMGAGVVEALRALGVSAEVENAERVQAASLSSTDGAVSGAPDRTRETLCYVRKQGTNIVVDGRKISGAAQRRTDKAVLQHGTIIVRRDEERMARLFRTPLDDIKARVTSLEEQGVRVSREKLVEALAAGFERALARPPHADARGGP